MTPELLNKLKHLANIAAHLPHDVTIEDEDATMKALHGELAADTVLQMIDLAERALLAAAPNPAVALEPWAPSEEQFEQWRARHGLHHSHNEAFYDAASLYLEATPPALAGSQVQAAGDTSLEDRVRDAVAAALGEAMDCTRVWSAWSYGTMGPDDFSVVANDDDRLDEIVQAALTAMREQP